MNTNRLWAIVRHGPGEAEPEMLVAVPDRATAAQLAGELGHGHHIAPIPVVEAAQELRVVHTWSCRASVHGTTVDVGRPEQLAGASRLLLPDEPEPVVDRVVVDDAAGALEAAVHGQVVHHLAAFAGTADRARALAEERAARLADDDPN